MKKYKTGEEARRPWGRYIVTRTGHDADGQEFCEKSITIEPGKVLSLQSHALRRERWTVLEGTLSAILDGQCIEVVQGQSIEIEPGVLHSMANMTTIPCVVREIQRGTCREDDIIRYADAENRETAPGASENNLSLYAAVLNATRKTKA